MSSTADSQTASQPQGPPYAPQNAGLGGIPSIIPDVPVSSVLLALYLVLGVIHLRILKNNKGRGHKFIFNGALLGLCKIRVVTMALRIAWSCHSRNVRLALAANVFVYVGTIILYLMNWFFVQRIVRAQHTRLGWSTPYRIFHRGVIVILILSLLSLIVAAIWSSFTLNREKLRVFRDMQLTGQTYFTFVCFAPIILVLISLVLPRREVEKFGAGRLRYNITILVISVLILSAGQVFRCVIAWLPPTPLREAGQPVAAPWYYHKACFYAFNFVTELIVIIMYAVVRIDLRFHVPNGSKMAGDYSARNSYASVNNIPQNEKVSNMNLASMSQVNSSSETLHAYQASVFDDTFTLADSLQYPSSTLTIDQRTGNWKVKRTSSGSSRSHRSSQSSLRPDRNTQLDDDIPPVPEIPKAWPLPSNQTRNSMPATSQSTSPSTQRAQRQQYELKDHALNDIDINTALTDTLNMLEANSQKNKFNTRTPPPQYSDGDAASSSSSKRKSFSHPTSNRRTYPPHSAYATSSNAAPPSPPLPVPIPSVYIPSLPQHSTDATPVEPSAPGPTIAGPSDPAPPSRSASLDIIKLAHRMSRHDSNPRILDVSLPTQESVPGSDFASTRCSSITRKTAPHADEAEVPVPRIDPVERVYSPSEYTSRTASSEAVRTEEGFRGFSFDAGRGGE